jgi:hypothetical protein
LNVTQSDAITRYVGKLAGLYPEDDLQALLCDEVMGALEGTNMMKRHSLLHVVVFVCFAALLPSFAADAQDASQKRKPDLADVAQGNYFGDVISDSQGSSRSDVTVTVSRIGKNLVRITSDYARLPAVEVPLTQAMDRILNARGRTTFVLDRTKNPNRLDISFMNEVSWAGQKQ